MSTNSLHDLMTQVMGHDQKGEAIPLKLADQLVAESARQPSRFRCAIPMLLRVSALIGERRFIEALATLHEILAKNPTNIEIQEDSQVMISEIAIEIEKSAQINPMMDGLGEIYESLLAFGTVPIRLHASVCAHYRKIGRPDKASGLEARLKAAAPCLLQMNKVPSEEKSSQEVALSENPRTREAHPQDFVSCSHLMEARAQIAGLIQETKYTQALEICRAVIEDPTLSPENRAFFRYEEACLLDYLGQPLDAVAIFVELAECSPTHLKYVRSLRIGVASLIKQAIELLERDPDSAAIQGYFNILDQVDCCPFRLKLGMSLLDAKQGRTVEARNRMVALVNLSPNDPDYLSAALDVASAINDQAWKGILLETIRSHLRRRPYLVRLQVLLAKHDSDTTIESQKEACSC